MQNTNIDRRGQPWQFSNDLKTDESVNVGELPGVKSLAGDSSIFFTLCLPVLLGPSLQNPAEPPTSTFISLLVLQLVFNPCKPEETETADNTLSCHFSATNAKCASLQLNLHKASPGTARRAAGVPVHRPALVCAGPSTLLGLLALPRGRECGREHGEEPRGRRTGSKVPPKPVALDLFFPTEQPGESRGPGPMSPQRP